MNQKPYNPFFQFLNEELDAHYEPTYKQRVCMYLGISEEEYDNRDGRYKSIFQKAVEAKFGFWISSFGTSGNESNKHSETNGLPITTDEAKDIHRLGGERLVEYNYASFLGMKYPYQLFPNDLLDKTYKMGDTIHDVEYIYRYPVELKYYIYVLINGYTNKFMNHQDAHQAFDELPSIKSNPRIIQRYNDQFESK